jgi:hypothetical protein
MATDVIPAPVHDGRRLDWFGRFDPASLDYPMAAGPATPMPTRGRLWLHGRILDQGNEGACCGFAAAAEAAAHPVPVPRVTNAYARGWYRKAQYRDVWPGEAYDGTSVLATCLEGRARGLYAGFRWAKRAEQLLAGVVAPEDEDGGPALLGVEWREGSYATDRLGVLRPSGTVVGGHALALIGAAFPEDLEYPDSELMQQLTELDLEDGVRAVLADEEAAAIVQNSWGEVFGKGGLCVVPLSVLRGWFQARGEFGQPVGRRLPPGTRGTTMTEQDEDGDVGTTTLHITLADVQPRDRILDPPEELGRESVTVRALPQLVSGRRARVATTAGSVTLAAATPVTVRRPQ